MRALLGPPTSAPAPQALSRTAATEALRFIWGDRDKVLGITDTTSAYAYAGLKLGDICHSNPQLVGGPSNAICFALDLNGYKAFAATYATRRRVLYSGADDGLLRAFDIGVWNRNTAVAFPSPAYPGIVNAGNAAPLTPFSPIFAARSSPYPGRLSRNFRRRYVSRNSFTRSGRKMCVCAPSRLCTRTSVASPAGSDAGIPYVPLLLVPLSLM